MASSAPSPAVALANEGQHRPAAFPAGGGPKLAGVLSFRVAAEVFALRLGEVAEVIRPPRLVRMPLTPPSLLGLANLRGTVLPVLSLRRLLGRADPLEEEGSTRVIVTDHGAPVGFLVDQILALQTVAVDQAAPPAAETAPAAAGFVEGVLKGAEGAPAITLLDVRRLLREKFAKLAMDAPAASGAPSTAAFARAAVAAPSAVQEVRAAFISFFLDAQEFALPLASMREIIPAPRDVAQVPRPETGVLGMITVRDRLLPLVSLRALLGLPEAARAAQRKVLVVTLGSHALGLVVDRMREVLRVSPTLIDAAPPLFSRGEGDAEITAVCRLDDGRRLVRLLTADTLFNANLAQRLLADGSTDAGGGGEGDTNGTPMTEEQFIVFQLAGQDYGLPLTAVAEVAPSPAAVTRLPQSPAFIEGVMNLRGSVVPLVNLRRRFALTGDEPAAGRRVLILSIEGVRCGFFVDRVREVLRIHSGAISAAPQVATEATSLITRVANLQAQGRLILIVDPARLLDRIEADLLKKFERGAAEQALQSS